MHLKMQSPIAMVDEDLRQMGRQSAQEAQTEDKGQHVAGQQADTVISRSFLSPSAAFIYPNLNQGRPDVSSVSITPLSCSKRQVLQLALDLFPN